MAPTRLSHIRAGRKMAGGWEHSVDPMGPRRAHGEAGRGSQPVAEVLSALQGARAWIARRRPRRSERHNCPRRGHPRSPGALAQTPLAERNRRPRVLSRAEGSIRDPTAVMGVHAAERASSRSVQKQDRTADTARKECRKALFSGSSITIFVCKQAGVANWPYGHRVGGEQTSYTPILAQLTWSSLPVTRRRLQRR